MERSTRKRKRSANPVKSQDNNTEQSCENSLDLNVYLTYDVLRMLFQYLNGRDLSNAAMVCRSWSEAASNEHCTRGPVCFIGDYSECSQVEHQIRDLYIKPRLGILFMPRIPENLKGHIDRTVPSDCEIVILYVPGIIINNEEMEDCLYPKVVCTFLPEIPNVSINTCQVIKLNSRKGYAAVEELNKMISRVPKVNHETSTCLMLFCNDSAREIANVMISALKKSHDDKICSVWGGVVDISYVHNSDWQVPYCIAVLISGAIRTWSTIIDVKCNTKEVIENRLKSFKDRIKLKKHSIGFMFVCTARGSAMHGKENVESTIFKTLFPNVPLVGCFGDGEFGKNTMDIDDAKEETSVNKQRNSGRNKHSRRKDVWYNEFSTVFMILTYG
ncbi:hypothetical protein DMN91_005101 [Ooceraea biroi]|uniref:F-box only protein n=1 Tax=Ooceraea biroi TaxID=2015173 RepID=A0A026WYS2_OOCBI|nr:F-box only protein 22 [Ooceraea biroi]EZA61162.1 F-box only protein [Ooceraea biroi]RLU22823.1 hypothetical protein DMN91_005101 [Ooceraea biroi]